MGKWKAARRRWVIKTAATRVGNSCLISWGNSQRRDTSHAQSCPLEEQGSWYIYTSRPARHCLRAAPGGFNSPALLACVGAEEPASFGESRQGDTAAGRWEVLEGERWVSPLPGSICHKLSFRWPKGAARQSMSLGMREVESSRRGAVNIWGPKHK